MKYKDYTFKGKKGITDLIPIYAFRGNSQGDTSETNSIEEYKAANGWLSFIFEGIDCNDQEAINKESERRIAENNVYIQKLKDSGEYGKEYESTISIGLVYRALFDEPNSFKE